MGLFDPVVLPIVKAFLFAGMADLFNPGGLSFVFGVLALNSLLRAILVSHATKRRQITTVVMVEFIRDDDQTGD